MNRVQRVFFVVAFVLCFVGIGLTVVSSEAMASYVVVVTTDANLRGGPGTQYAVVSGAYAGARLTVHESSNGWYKVTGGLWIWSGLTKECGDPQQVCDFLRDS